MGVKHGPEKGLNRAALVGMQNGTEMGFNREILIG
jgi:hypothetical protein